MEALTRLVTESLVRHGFDRPLDYRRLHWSHWFRCESVHSLLFVPSKPGVFALAEEITDFPAATPTAVSSTAVSTTVEERRFSAASSTSPEETPFRARTGSPDARRLTPDASSPRRMLAVTQFFEDDDMAFVLDRMLSHENPMRARLLSGRYFIRFVAIEDPTQRRSICAALNQWMSDSAEKATGIGPHFATSLELTPATEYIRQVDESQQTLFGDASVGRTLLSATADSSNPHVVSSAHVETAASALPRTLSETKESGPGAEPAFSVPTFSPTAPHLDSGAASNLHCPSPLPSGF